MRARAGEICYVDNLSTAIVSVMVIQIASMQDCSPIAGVQNRYECMFYPLSASPRFGVCRSRSYANHPLAFI